jgi:hypothetical protein
MKTTYSDVYIINSERELQSLLSKHENSQGTALSFVFIPKHEGVSFFTEKLLPWIKALFHMRYLNNTYEVLLKRKLLLCLTSLLPLLPEEESNLLRLLLDQNRNCKSNQESLKVFLCLNSIETLKRWVRRYFKEDMLRDMFMNYQDTMKILDDLKVIRSKIKRDLLQRLEDQPQMKDKEKTTILIQQLLSLLFPVDQELLTILAQECHYDRLCLEHLKPMSEEEKKGTREALKAKRAFIQPYLEKGTQELKEAFEALDKSIKSHFHQLLPHRSEPTASSSRVCLRKEQISMIKK